MCYPCIWLPPTFYYFKVGPIALVEGIEPPVLLV
jgi:hypothetical protein